MSFRFAGIATQSGREQQFENCMKSLESQVDKIFFLKDSEYGDAAKFIAVNEHDGYFFTGDDDLIFPEDYCKRMIAKLKEYDNQVIVTCHGRNFNHYPIKSYYRDYQSKYACLDAVQYDTFVQVGGTGCMAFHTDFFRPEFSEFKNGFMADLFLSLQAQKKKIPILVMAHQKGWIVQQETNGGIYEKYRNNDKVQTDFFNSWEWVIYQTETT